MALNDEIKQVTDNWAVKLSTDLTDSMLKALKDAGRTNPSATNLRFEPQILTYNDRVIINILSVDANGNPAPYWYWIEHGRDKTVKSGNGIVREGVGKKWQLGNGINPINVVYNLQVKYNKDNGLKRKVKRLNLDKAIKTLSFLISRKIHKKGYKARPFIDRVINDGRVNDLAEQLANVMGKNLVIELDINGSN